MPKDLENRLAKNRKSPANETELIQAYKNINTTAQKLGDGLDVAAVTAKDGTRGYGLMPEKFNRSRDTDFHRVKDFISEKELKSQAQK